MKKIILILPIIFIASCLKEESSKVIPPENEITIPFETVAIGINSNLSSNPIDTSSKCVGFHFKDEREWQSFKTKYLDLFSTNVEYQKSIDFNSEDIISLIHCSSDGSPYIEVKKITKNDSAILVFYRYTANSDLFTSIQPYHIIKTKKLDKKIICIQQ
jgi:hypothetical protein